MTACHYSNTMLVPTQRRLRTTMAGMAGAFPVTSREKKNKFPLFPLAYVLVSFLSDGNHFSCDTVVYDTLLPRELVEVSCERFPGRAFATLHTSRVLSNSRLTRATFNPFTPKKYILPTFQREMYKRGSENRYSIIIFRLSKLWKAMFSTVCDVIFLVRLQEKFDIDHFWEWEG